MPAHFEDIEVGQVVTLGVAAVDGRSLDSFCSALAPGWSKEDGAPDAFTYALWSRLDTDASSGWALMRFAGCAIHRRANYCADA